MSYFYLYIFVLLGIAAAATSLVVGWSKSGDIGAHPLWIYKYGAIFRLISFTGNLVALGIVSVRYDFFYFGVSVGELFIGAFLLGFCSKTFKYYIAFISPVIVFWSLGPLLKFWYLSQFMMVAFPCVVLALYLYIKSTDKQSISNVRVFTGKSIPPNNKKIINESNLIVEKQSEIIGVNVKENNQSTKIQLKPTSPEIITAKGSSFWWIILMIVAFIGFVYFSYPDKKTTTIFTSPYSPLFEEKGKHSEPINLNSKVVRDYSNTVKIEMRKEPEAQENKQSAEAASKPLELGQERVVQEGFMATDMFVPAKTLIVLTAIENAFIDFMFEIDGQLHSERVDYSTLRNKTK